MGRPVATTYASRVDTPRHLRLNALGTTLRVQFDAGVPRQFIGAVAHAWRRCVDVAAPLGDHPAADTLVLKHPSSSEPEHHRAALQQLSRDVTLRLIAAQTGRLLMFHAGAVADPRTGDTLVFIAPSGTGKTTLALTLGAHFGYVTDETVGVDPHTGRIHPYPKPLSIITGSGRGKTESSPDSLGLLLHHGAPRLAKVVLLDRRHKATRACLEPLDVLTAIEGIVPQSSALNRLPRPLRTLAEILEATGSVHRLTYSEASEALPVLAQLMGAET